MGDDKLLQYYVAETRHTSIIKVYPSFQLPSKFSVSLRISPIHINCGSQTVRVKLYIAMGVASSSKQSIETYAVKYFKFSKDISLLHRTVECDPAQ